jgi:hypothetical protein
MVATQNAISNFVGRGPPILCILYVRHPVSLLFRSVGKNSQTSIVTVLLPPRFFRSLTDSVAGATVLMTLIGFPWAITQWVPFSLVRQSYCIWAFP